MKKRLLYLLGLLVLLATGCKKADDFLTQLPLDQLTDQNYWTSEANVRSFAWGFYPHFFVGYGQSYTKGDRYFSAQSLNDDFAPPTPTPFPIAVPTSGGGWTFSWVRKANIFINRVKKVPMDTAAIHNWVGVGRFFRAMEYADLVNRFGDVPYYDKEVSEADSLLYKPRDPRTRVMDSVLEDFRYAAAHVRVSDPGTGPAGLIVNKYVVLAFMSRIFLFEGTWQKYHDGDQAKATEYLQAAKRAADQLMTSGGYSPGKDYRALFSSESLAGNPGIIMYREYASGMLTHTIMSANNGASQFGASRDLIDAYLCDDGLPISLSPEYKGDTSIQDVMADRDPRMAATFVDELRLPGLVSNYSSSGYACHKFLNDAAANTPEGTLDQNATDAPVIRLGEVMLNYAEACAELGTLTQEDLDRSVNKLRARAGVDMPPLEVIGGKPAVNGVVYDDPARDPDVPAMIWEIRRERRIGLVYEGFRLDDLRRWGKLNYLDTKDHPDVNLGAWIRKSDYLGTSAEIAGNAAAGYIIPSPVTQRTFDDPKVYLSPIPLDQITLYKDHGVSLAQNPGW